MKNQVLAERIIPAGKFTSYRFVPGDKATLQISAESFVEVIVCEFDVDGFGEKPTEKGVCYD